VKAAQLSPILLLFPRPDQGCSIPRCCFEVSGRAQGASPARLGRCFVEACTDTALCRQQGPCCSTNVPPHWDFWVSTHLCQARFSYECALLRAAITESTKEGKTSRRGSLLAKRTSLGLQRGHRLYASLPWRNEFHMPFPIFPSSI